MPIHVAAALLHSTYQPNFWVQRMALLHGPGAYPAQWNRLSKTAYGDIEWCGLVQSQCAVLAAGELVRNLAVFAEGGQAPYFALLCSAGAKDMPSTIR